MGMEMPFVKEKKNQINLSVFQKIKSQSKAEKKSRLKGKEILDENILF